MIGREELEKYKNYPDGSNGKKLYDYYNLTFSSFLSKYYRNPDLKRWHYVYDKFVNPIFQNDNLEEYFQFLNKSKPNFSVSINKAIEFFTKIQNDTRFDYELKCFFSFLYSIDFFRDTKFEDWLEIGYWNHPWYTENDSNLLPISQIVEHENGLNFLKDQLSMLSVF